MQSDFFMSIGRLNLEICDKSSIFDVEKHGRTVLRLENSTNNF